MDQRDAEQPSDQTTYHVGRAREGDVKSLEWLIRRLSPLLLHAADYRLGKRLRELYDPEDIVNDVWLGVIPKIGDLSSRDGRHTPVLVKYLSKTLVYRINNLIEKHITGKPAKQRSRNAEGEPTSGISQLLHDTISSATRLSQSETQDTVTASLEKLAARDRELIILRGIEQRPYKEIATLLKRDRKVLAVEYQRALTKLQKQLPGSVFHEFLDD